MGLGKGYRFTPCMDVGLGGGMGESADCSFFFFFLFSGKWGVGIPQEVKRWEEAFCF